ncbi:MAG TPA: FtsQ-type POTRA domain-containing protein, partial [Thermoanaerobaculia bacterium]|nr:FtsQ-type POTRA domain-containing protein [Thermoanaerobaculia bacterium]
GGDPPRRSAGASVVPVRRPPAGETVAFRRRAVKPRRRRRSPWRRLLRPAVWALLIVGSPLAAATWVLTTPRFALAEMSVAGTERVDGSWVERRLAPFAGRNLLALRLAEAARALAGHPWIAGVSLRKDLPRRLVVEVVERRPAALVPGPEGLWLADREGTPIVPAPPGAEERFLVVVAPPGRRAVEVPAALDLAAEVSRLAPVWAAGLVRLDALGEGDFRLHTSALPAPVTVRDGRLAQGAAWVERARPAIEARHGGAWAFDARFAGRLVARPAAAREAGNRSTDGGTDAVGTTG